MSYPGYLNGKLYWTNKPGPGLNDQVRMIPDEQIEHYAPIFRKIHAKPDTWYTGLTLEQFIARCLCPN